MQKWWLRVPFQTSLNFRAGTSQPRETSTYFHNVAGVSEVGEGAEGGEHRLCGSHQTLWHSTDKGATSLKVLFTRLPFSLFLKCDFHRTLSGSGVMESKSSQLQSTCNCKPAEFSSQSRLLLFIPPLLSLPPLPCLSLSAAARTSNRCFSCSFWPLGGGAYVQVAFFIPQYGGFYKTL